MVGLRSGRCSRGVTRGDRDPSSGSSLTREETTPESFTDAAIFMIQPVVGVHGESILEASQPS
jgi:hypothetical protein